MNDDRLYGGRYRLLDVIGDGGMARVFRATDTRLDRTVAIKLLREQFTGEPLFIERFKQEARLAAGLAHPNVVGVYDVGEENGQYYMVMEYVPGDNLKQIISREAPMPLGTVVGFMRQLAAALDYAHTHGVIHRDIKPENILVTDRREVKVGDFGIARALAGSSLTATGTVLGSVSYFSPEQASGQPATAESDLYSAGMVLFEMLTGHVPFSGPNPVAVAMAQVNDPPTLPTNFVPELPRAVEAVVLKAIAKDPSQRYHSGYELMAALTAAARPAAVQPAAPLLAAVQADVPRARRAAPVVDTADAAQTLVAGSQVLAAVPPRPGRRGAGGAIVALVSTAILLLAAVLVWNTISGNDSATSSVTGTTTPPPIETATRVQPTRVPVVVPPTDTALATATIVVVSQTSTPVPNPSDTPATADTALATATSALVDSATPLPTTTAGLSSATPAIPDDTPTTVTGTATTGTATPASGSSHGATVDLVTAAKVGPHYSAVGVSTEFTAGTSTVYAVAKVHGKAKGDVIKFVWQYPDGSTFPLEIPDLTSDKGDISAYAEITPRGPGNYTVSTTINGHVLASVSFSVAAKSSVAATPAQASESPTAASGEATAALALTASPGPAETATALVPASTTPVALASTIPVVPADATPAASADASPVSAETAIVPALSGTVTVQPTPGGSPADTTATSVAMASGTPVLGSATPALATDTPAGQ